MRSCERLNDILKKRYDIDLLKGRIDHDHISMVFEHYSSRLHGHSLNESPQYSKAFLIAETARAILREIAPKRTKKKKGVS
jgi:hypothetical protein